MTRNHLLAASFAALAFASPAAAQTAAYEVGTGKAVLLTPFNLLNVQDLDFGSYVLPTGVGGTVALSPLDGSITSPVLISMPSSAPVRGQFLFAGTANQPVTVTISSFSGWMCAGGSGCTSGLATTLALDGVERPAENGVYDYVLDGNGLVAINVGGSVAVPVGTADGDYGENYEVSLSYE